MDKEQFFYVRTAKHIANVILNVVKVVEEAPELLKQFNVDIPKLIKNTLEHDQTKLKEPQRSKYIEINWYYYQKHLGKAYPLDKVSSSTATILHIVSEKHHPEFWDDTFLLEPQKFNTSNRDGLPDKPVDATKMPPEAIVEMVCDWAAVAKERKSNLQEWVDFTVNKRWLFTDRQTKLIYKLVAFFKA